MNFFPLNSTKSTKINKTNFLQRDILFKRKKINFNIKVLAGIIGEYSSVERSNAQINGA